jgi:cytidyltransferase-like protein
VELGGERAHVSVGVNTDDFIKRYKGSYPVMSLVERLEMLRAIRWVDDVLINKGNEDCKVLIDEVKPDLLVVGSDWLGKDYLKQTGLTREYLERRDIALVFLPYTVGISTTALKARLK